MAQIPYKIDLPVGNGDETIPTVVTSIFFRGETRMGIRIPVLTISCFMLERAMPDLALVSNEGLTMQLGDVELVFEAEDAEVVACFHNPQQVRIMGTVPLSAVVAEEDIMRVKDLTDAWPGASSEALTDAVNALSDRWYDPIGTPHDERMYFTNIQYQEIRPEDADIPNSALPIRPITDEDWPEHEDGIFDWDESDIITDTLDDDDPIDSFLDDLLS